MKTKWLVAYSSPAIVLRGKARSAERMCYREAFRLGGERDVCQCDFINWKSGLRTALPVWLLSNDDEGSS